MIRFSWVTLTLSIVSFSSVSNSQNLSNFPLWGSTWFIAQGENQRVLYPSVSPLEPRSAILVQFTGQQPHSVVLRWANLNHRDYAVTSDLLSDIKAQLISRPHLAVSQTEINRQSYVDINYQTFDDTTWSCDEAILSADTRFTRFYRDVNGQTEELDQTRDADRLRTSPLYTAAKPICYGRRAATANDRDLFINCTEGKCFFERPLAGDESFEPYCDDFNKYMPTYSCYEAIGPLRPRTQGLGFWTVHLYPEVVYLCREPETGKPILDPAICPPMTAQEAILRKKQSLDNPADLNLQRYRNPYLSDSASTIISFSFVDDGTPDSPLRARPYIWLSGSRMGSPIPFEHYPNRMFRVDQDADLDQAILLTYTESPLQEQNIRTLDIRCPGWRVVDEQNGFRFYPPALRQGGRYRPAPGLDKGNYIYNGCPASPKSDIFNLTPVQIRRLVQQPPPMCAWRSMTRALGLYRIAERYLTAPADQRLVAGRIAQMREVMTRRGRIAYNPRAETACPEHPIDVFFR